MGNTALSDILNRDDVLEHTPVTAKRGVSTHLGAITDDLKALAKSDRDPTETEMVELHPTDILFSDSINHRCQDWLSDENQSFQKLVQSIEIVGQKLPIMVRPLSGGRYELIYGSRRRQAALHLGIKVKAIIANGVSDNDAHELAILENTNHSGLSPIEEARAVLAYKERNAPIADKEVAIVFTKSRQWVGFQLSFANIDPLLIEQCSNPWTISERATRELRAQWINNKAKRIQWTKSLEKLQKEKTKLPFKKLLDHLTGVKSQDGIEVLKDKEGRVIAEVGGTSTKNGRRIRRVCIYEGFNKTAMTKLVESLSEDFDR